MTAWKPRAGHTMISDYRTKGQTVTCCVCGVTAPKLSPMQRATCGSAACKREHDLERHRARYATRKTGAAK